MEVHGVVVAVLDLPQTGPIARGLSLPKWTSFLFPLLTRRV